MYDAIVVGARCAGSPTAMLLARQGHRVLLVDRAVFPSDTLSIHYIHQPGVARLQRWGLLGQVAASNCPPIRRLDFDTGPFVLSGPPAPADGVADGYAPRRTVLDKILVDAAAAAGAEVRERFTVEALLTDGTRVTGIRGREHSRPHPVVEKARIVIGADGPHSLVARSVGAHKYNEKPVFTCAYYAYWRGVSVVSAELYARPDRMIIAAPTNHGQVVVIVYWPIRAFQEMRTDIERHFLEAAALAPRLAERLAKGERVERFRGTADLPNFFRKPCGPGWALVGDAGYHKDPITALGISDAFRDAELLAEAVHEGLSGSRPMEEALAEYQRRRDQAAVPLYELTCQNAALQPPPPEMQALLAALRANPEQTSRFFGAMTGAVPVADFFAPENLKRVVGEVA
ncbi:MAG: NAD(P)/FAD-dependent oxidoreductase [Acidobacteria bacterium]|nr:NAD(P)/FAD-dependent oxidoreductase [Acidobacteriota bacterium]